MGGEICAKMEFLKLVIAPFCEGEYCFSIFLAFFVREIKNFGAQ